MLQSMTWAGIWLVQRAALSDTVYTKQLASVPSTFERITSIASGLLTVALLVLVIGAMVAAWSFRRSYLRMNRILERMYSDITPIVRHANSVADNVNYITTSIRTDVQQISATIATANERLQEAVKSTERRLGDFNALLKVVQEEAEQMFVSTAAAVRGVRTSASAMSEPDSGTKFARRGEEVEVEEDEGGDDELDLDSEVDTEEEMSNVYDSDAATAEDDVARPRLRSRRGRPGERGPSAAGGRPRSH
jgi:uncharacterized protein YoxC